MQREAICSTLRCDVAIEVGVPVPSIAKNKHTSGPPCASFEHILGSRARPATPTARHLPKGDPSLVTRTTNREPLFEHSLTLPLVMSRQNTT